MTEFRDILFSDFVNLKKAESLYFRDFFRKSKRK